MDMTFLSNPKVQNMLMAAGLSMLANNQNRVGVPPQSFGSSLGQGLLTGVQYANQQEDLQRKQANEDREYDLKKGYQEGQLSHMGNQDSLARDSLEWGKEQFGKTHSLNEAKFGADQKSDAARIQLAQDNLVQQAQRDALRAREYAEGAPQRELALTQGNLAVDQAKKAQEVAAARQALIPAANGAVAKALEAVRAGQPMQVSPEEMNAVMSVYGDKPEFINKVFGNQLMPIQDPTTGQTINVPVSAGMRHLTAVAKQGEDPFQTAVREAGGSTAPKVDPQLASQYAQRVQQALQGRTPQEQAQLKQQMRQELSSFDPAFLSAIGL